jgi:hypothetical protein
MAKGKVSLPPRKSIGSTINKIQSQGPKAPSAQVMSRGAKQSFVQHVQRSKIPTPTQNQRGRIMTTNSRDLTR